jgi:ankyrin repeat protein
MKDVEGRSLLFHAVTLQDKEIVRILLVQGADPNIADDSDLSPLQVACEPRNEQAIIKLLLDGGAHPDTLCHGGLTLLHHATFHGRLRTMEILLSNRADPNLLRATSKLVLSDLTGQSLHDSALHTAIASERPHIAQLLINHGADVNIRDVCGATTLHLAVDYSSSDSPVRLGLIDLLLDAGADVNAKRDDSRTALHVATCHVRCLRRIKVLCGRGVDVTMKDSNEETALQYVDRLPVSEVDRRRMTNVLKTAGNHINIPKSTRESLKEKHDAVELDWYQAECKGENDLNASDSDSERATQSSELRASVRCSQPRSKPPMFTVGSSTVGSSGSESSAHVAGAIEIDHDSSDWQDSDDAYIQMLTTESEAERNLSDQRQAGTPINRGSSMKVTLRPQNLMASRQKSVTLMLGPCGR